jgi:hypothetical protein
MNHPTREEWVPYVFGETTAETRRRLKRHLNDCPECRMQVLSWTQSLRRMGNWELPTPRAQSGPWWMLARWATAGACAGLLLLAGIAVGRLAGGPGPEPRSVRNGLSEEFRPELAALVREEVARAVTFARAEMEMRARAVLAAYARDVKSGRLEDKQQCQAALEAVYVSLKRDLDTVAVLTEASFRATQRRMGYLADNRTAAGHPDSTPSQ